MATKVDWQIQGSAYDRPEPSFETDLSDVSRGTPTGEMLRRYWHPIAVANEIGDLPRAVKVLGEDLVQFQTTRREFGLVYLELKPLLPSYDILENVEEGMTPVADGRARAHR